MNICWLSRGWLWLILSIVMLSEVARADGQFTVVLDAGHGGKDPGAMGHGAREKMITLGIVLKLGQLIKEEHPAVKVLYTRERDVFVGLQARADFANKHKASLFISVHVNSAAKGIACGTETYVLGLSKQSNNLSVAMRENKAMLLEEDYKTKYKGFDPTSAESYIMFDLMQEAYLGRSIEMANFVERQYKRIGRPSRGVRQDGFWVLSQSAMPSILTEVGFISHSAEAAFLNSEEGQAQMARALANAFTAFYEGNSQGRERASDKAPSNEDIAEEIGAGASTPNHSAEGSRSPKQETQTKQTSQGASTYRIQFMSTPQKIDTSSSQFRKLKHKVKRTKEGKNYVYTIGETKSLSEARKLRKAIAGQYKDCFIVEYKAGKRIGRTK